MTRLFYAYAALILACSPLAAQSTAKAAAPAGANTSVSNIVSEDDFIKTYHKPRRFKPGEYATAPSASETSVPAGVVPPKAEQPSRVQYDNRYNKPKLGEIEYEGEDKLSYYNSRSIPRYNDILQYEPLKVNAWSAQTAKKGMMILHPQASFAWGDGYGAVIPSFAMHYGITNELELTLVPSGTIMTSDMPEGMDSAYFNDLPVHLRYMFLNYKAFILTAKAHVGLPTNTLVTTNYENGYALQFQYNCDTLALSFYVNGGYTIVFERDGYKPDNYFSYAAGAEYALDNTKWQFMLEVSGNQDRGDFITPSVSYDLSESSLLRLGGNYDFSDKANNSVFLNATFILDNVFGSKSQSKYAYR